VAQTFESISDKLTAFVERQHLFFDDLRALFGEHDAVRAVITADIDRTSSSCGFAVPLMDHVGDRHTLGKYFENKSDQDVEAYWAEKNQTSIDGLPAVDAAN